MTEDFTYGDHTFALVTKHDTPGAAWLAHMWDGDTDFYTAWTSRRAAERWLTLNVGSLPKPERNAPNQYYYEWDESA